MTDNGIMQALESAIHRFKDANHHVSCIVDINILKKAINLINRQKAEIERLQDFNENLQTGNTALSNEILEIKSEAIKEFAERLKEGIQENHYYTSTEDMGNRKRYVHITNIKDFSQYIDNLVKEMTEEIEK